MQDDFKNYFKLLGIKIFYRYIIHIIIIFYKYKTYFLGKTQCLEGNLAIIDAKIAGNISRTVEKNTYKI